MAQGSGGETASIGISISWSESEGVAEELTLSLPAGATALDAIRASGLLERQAGIDLSTQAIGVWGRACEATTPLKENDRVEIYRPLVIDPKEARRLRASRR